MCLSPSLLSDSRTGRMEYKNTDGKSAVNKEEGKAIGRSIDMKFVLATQNPKKKAELAAILGDLNIEIVTEEELGQYMLGLKHDDRLEGVTYEQ